MLIVFYRNEEGKIIRHHKAPKNMDADELGRRIAEINADPNNKQTVFVEELAPGSTGLYLYEKEQYGIRYTKESIEEAIDAIETARDCINSLQEAGENG